MGSSPSRLPTQSSQSYHQPVSTQREGDPQDELEWTEPTQQRQHAHIKLIWPLPPNEVYSPFEVKDNSDWDQYSLTPISPRTTTPSVTSRSKARAIDPYNEKDTSSEDWKKQTDSKIIDSAQVQSQLSARFHACFNLSTPDNIGMVMNGLKKTQQNLDARLKRRLTKISADAEQKIMLVVDYTKEEQKLLLAYDKKRQLRQDELHQEWLQKYVVELNS